MRPQLADMPTNACFQPKGVAEVLLDEATLQSRIDEIASDINRDYQGKTVILLCILKGSIMFTADLMKRLHLDCRVDFMSISSYGDATESAGVVKLVKDASEDISGQHVLIIEDIIDSGLTLDFLCKTLTLRQPKSLKICTLLSKPSRRKVELPVDYLGFEIEDKFVVGYGLDCASKFRNLPYVGVVDPEQL